MMLAREQGPRACRAAPRIWRLLSLLALVFLLVNASHVKAAKCDTACRECKNSCTSQKLNCLTHARANRISLLGDCTPGRSGRPCRTLARQTFMRARSECTQSATACRSCCKANDRGGCVTTTTTTVMASTTTSVTSATTSTTTSTTTTTPATTTTPSSTTSSSTPTSSTSTTSPTTTTSSTTTTTTSASTTTSSPTSTTIP